MGNVHRELPSLANEAQRVTFEIALRHVALANGDANHEGETIDYTYAGHRDNVRATGCALARDEHYRRWEENRPYVTFSSTIRNEKFLWNRYSLLP